MYEYICRVCGDISYSASDREENKPCPACGDQKCELLGVANPHEKTEEEA